MLTPELYAHVTAQASVFALVSGVLFSLGWFTARELLEAGVRVARRAVARRRREGVPGVSAAL